MSDTRIESAMTPKEWRDEAMDEPSILGDIRYIDNPKHLAKIIALANSQLPDDDPRKVTRGTVAELRGHAHRAPDGSWDRHELSQIADALESYLPPEGA